MKIHLAALSFITYICILTACSSYDDSHPFADSKNPPNIIFIMADDLGYGDLGSYGQKDIRTPRLDQMATEGLRFTQFYSGHTVCAPARSSLMTGLHTGQTRVRDNFSNITGGRVPLEPQDTTVAEILQQAGYTTGLVGKWGLGEPGTTGIPNLKGFDYFWGFLNQRRAHTYYPEWVWRNTDRVILEGNQNGMRTQYSHDLDIQEAMNFIRMNRERPFFLYLALQIPHAEMSVPDDSLEEYLDDQGNSIFDETPFPHGQHHTYIGQEMPTATYAAMVTRMDRDIGALIDLLQSLGIDENTIVFFTSDNGPHSAGGYQPEFLNSNGPLRGKKRDLYEGGIRVPMIVRMPGTVPAGEVSDHMWAMWDFLPTAAELARTQPTSHTNGRSVVNALLNRFQKDPEYLYWENHAGGFRQAARFGNWKAISPGINQPIELYDLAMDIGEEHNLADIHPEIIARAKEIFNNARTDSEHWPVDF